MAHASVADAEPNALSIAAEDGLHPSGVLSPVAVITGASVSTVQVTVRDANERFLQGSIAVNVLVCERLHPLLNTSPSLDSTVGVPQASVAVAEPSAALIAAVEGLQPAFNVVPVAVSVGGVTSSVHVAVRDVVDVLPQPSVAVNVLVCEREHPLL